MRNSAVHAVCRGLSRAPNHFPPSGPAASLALPRRPAGPVRVLAPAGAPGTPGDFPAVDPERTHNPSRSEYARSPDDVMNSSITEFGGGRSTRPTSRQNTLGYDSDVFEPGGAPHHGAVRVHVRSGTRRDTLRRRTPLRHPDVRR